MTDDELVISPGVLRIALIESDWPHEFEAPGCLQIRQNPGSGVQHLLTCDIAELGPGGLATVQLTWPGPVGNGSFTACADLIPVDADPQPNLPSYDPDTPACARQAGL